jgi:hypothetical protein
MFKSCITKITYTVQIPRYFKNYFQSIEQENHNHKHKARFHINHTVCLAPNTMLNQDFEIFRDLLLEYHQLHNKTRLTSM